MTKLKVYSLALKFHHKSLNGKFSSGKLIEEKVWNFFPSLNRQSFNNCLFVAFQKEVGRRVKNLPDLKAFWFWKFEMKVNDLIQSVLSFLWWSNSVSIFSNLTNFASHTENWIVSFYVSWIVFMLLVKNKKQ